ncbi:maleylpyruvate isomerase family mycothiol-dependent enzyme [Goodfellowiella coeruleoviolacea]|uniref:TIGR03083 family protein n=1 Tax=Goodfellowiella coeruleoviolacea TaxID=334858 RepID=A0AAE3GFC2_9PSEU|nr:maleylpyruvate isomerase family mycothiol-dependent enzyme [Goodfellowiella coeruleoviolacea]MCP2166289.1 TIGR03083 family protein [Goodfellowiella coeruleoviolacea]
MSDSPWGPPLDARPVLRDTHQRLLALLADLSPTQWNAPTACAGWTVRDIANHLLGNVLGRLSRDRDQHQPLAPRPGEEFTAFLHRINDEWVRAAVRLSPRVLVALLASAGAELCAHWDGLDLAALGGSVSWAGPEPAPVWLDVAREYTECWVHQQQIREAVGAPRLDEPEFRAPVVDTFMRGLPHSLRAVPAAAGTTVVFTVTGDSGGSWTATRQDARWTLRRGGVAAPDATLATDADTFWRLCTRNLAPADADLRTSGDPALTAAAGRLVSIII